MSKTTHIQYAPDLAKAMGIFLVVFGHVLRGLMNAGIVQSTAFWLEVDKLIYLFHMPLFFFLSGLFFRDTLNRRGYTSMILRNVTVLLIPLVFWSYLQFGMQYLAAGSTNISLTLNDVLTAPIPPRQQFWFLWALFKITVLVGALMQFNKSNLFLGALVVVTSILNLMGYGEIGAQTWGSDIVRNIPYFIIGIMGGVRVTADYRIGNLAAFFVFILSLFLYSVLDFYPEITRLATSTLCLLALYKIVLNYSNSLTIKGLGALNRITIFVGMNSMIIYLAHVIFEAGFRALLIKTGVINIPLHLLGGVAVGMAVPLVLVPFGLRGAKTFPHLFSAILPVRNQRG